MYFKNNILIFVLLLSFKNLYAFPSLKNIISKDSLELLKTADSYYLNREYQTSLLFYEYLYQNVLDKSFQSKIKPKLILNYLRLKENFYHYDEERIKNLIFYSHSDNFIENYIDLYASFRFDYKTLSFSKINKILNSSSIPIKHKDYGKLIYGAIYFDENLDEAYRYYKKLEEESEEVEVKNISFGIRTKIEDFHQNFSYKKPYIAGILSSILPGMGYIYTKHYTDAISSFFWNSVFLGGGIYMYQLEQQTEKNHVVSYSFLLFGLTVYVSNIIGSYTSAIRHNNYHIRLFYQELRNTYFNTNFVEQTSGIQFQIQH